MTTIDHRILIPAAPDVVWDYVSDITHNPDWQVDCTDVIFLTSRREGPGLRWRYATPGGHEMVIAVTAWYNGLGYEYYFVDGTPFRENKGRIRLQEIPEGTVVQWTFTYELGGLLGGVRNSFGMSRQVDQTISESLKQLWQKIKQSGGTSRTLEPKSLMREAPDVEARSAYQPRHPSVVDHDEIEEEKPLRLSPSRFKIEPPIIDEDAQNFPVIEEPPVVDDDTRPRPAAAVPVAEPARVQDEPEPDFLDSLAEDDFSRFEPPRQPAVAASASPEAEPDFLDSLAEDDFSRFEPPRAAAETIPEPPVDQFDTPVSPQKPVTSELDEETLTDLPAEFEEAEPQDAPETYTPAAEQPEVEVEAAVAEVDDDEDEIEATIAVATDVSEETQLQLDDEATVAQEQAPQVGETEPLSTEPVPQAGSASIWEIFGVPRPSETHETEAVTDAAAPEAETAAPEQDAAQVDDEPPTVTGIEEATPAPDAELTSAEQELPDVDTVILPSTLLRAEAGESLRELRDERTASRTGLRVALRRRQVRLRSPQTE